MEVHARKYYPTLVGPDVIFWRFDLAVLPSIASAKPDPSVTGDDCHYDIMGLSDTQLRSAFLNRPVSEFTIVDAGVQRAFCVSDIM